MITADLNALNAPLDSFVISGETASHVDSVVEDLISASIAQDAFQKTLPDLRALPPAGTAKFTYASRIPTSSPRLGSAASGTSRAN